MTWTLIHDRHFNALAEGLSEILATHRGESDQPIGDILEHVLSECDKSPKPTQNPDWVQLLNKILNWASSRCPADDESIPCPLCGARADIPGDACKAVENIFPRDLLNEIRNLIPRTRPANGDACP